MRWTLLCCICLATCLALVPVPAGDASSEADAIVVYKGARILTAAGDPIEKGVLVVHKGKIVAVGPEDRVPVPE